MFISWSETKTYFNLKEINRAVFENELKTGSWNELEVFGNENGRYDPTDAKTFSEQQVTNQKSSWNDNRTISSRRTGAFPATTAFPYAPNHSWKIGLRVSKKKTLL